MHLWTSTQGNPAVYSPGSLTTANTDARRILSLQNPTQGAYFSSLFQLDDGGSGTYNGLLLSVQRRIAGGATLLADYCVVSLHQRPRRQRTCYRCKLHEPRESPRRSWQLPYIRRETRAKPLGRGPIAPVFAAMAGPHGGTLANFRDSKRSVR